MPARASSRPSSRVPLPDLVGDAAGLGVLDEFRRRPRRTGRSTTKSPLGGGPVHAAQRGEPLPQVAEVLLDLVRADLGVLHGDLDGGQVGQVEPGPDVHLGGEGELLAVVELGDLQLGLAERADLAVLQRLPVQLRHRVVDRLLQHGAAAQPLVDDLWRDVARPEPGDPDLPAHLAVSLVEAGLQLLEGNLDGQLHPGRAELLDIGLHGGVTPWSPARWSARAARWLWSAARRPGGGRAGRAASSYAGQV